jgi:PRC-barrel domain
MSPLSWREGFSDVHVVPSRAKDKDGNPVVMSISADSFAEVSEVGSSRSGNSVGPMDSNADAPGSRFVSIANSDELSSNVVGLDVYDNDNKSVGQIKDIAMNQRGRADAYICRLKETSERFRPVASARHRKGGRSKRQSRR